MDTNHPECECGYGLFNKRYESYDIGGSNKYPARGGYTPASWTCSECGSKISDEKYLEMKDEALSVSLKENFNNFKPECKCGEGEFSYRRQAKYTPGSNKYPHGDFVEAHIVCNRCNNKISFEEYIKMKEDFLKTNFKTKRQNLFKPIKKQTKFNKFDVSASNIELIVGNFIKTENTLKEHQAKLDLDKNNFLVQIQKLKSDFITTQTKTENGNDSDTCNEEIEDLEKYMKLLKIDKDKLKSCNDKLNELNIKFKRISEIKKKIRENILLNELNINTKDDKCVVCLDAPIEGIFAPCGHSCCCLYDTQDLSDSEKECPICKEKIISFIKKVIY